MKLNSLGTIFLTFFLIVSCTIKKKSNTDQSKDKEEIENVSYVNTFIGTGGHGHTFPGATTPNGMVQLSPDTRTSGWDACGGYHYSDNSIMGFSHTHLSGTGIGDLGDILFMPYTGETHIKPGSAENPQEGYRSRFSHDTEKATPGYYAVKLSDYNIDVELTASKRAGFHQYTYPESTEKKMIIDLSHTVHDHFNTNNEIKVLSDTEIIGHKVTKGWAKNHHVYFYAKFDRPFLSTFYSNDSIQPNLNTIKSNKVVAVLNFKRDTKRALQVKVGISSVDYEGAKKNLNEEIPDWDFNRVRKKAHKEWVKELDKIQIKGGTEEEKTIFYTGLYHTSLSPYIFSDVDGRYRGMDQKIHKSDSNENIYTVFSLWDTFRAFHPLQTITNPERNTAFINSLLKKYEHGGILPKWELAANYTGTMIGYHSIPVIVDAYFKGDQNFDVNKAYEAMVRTASYDTTGIYFPSEGVKNKLSPLAKKYNEELGFIPSDKENEAVSKALEYAYNDWCIAQMAKDLGKEKDYKRFMERSKRYKKYFDQETGFMRGVKEDGTFREPFDPAYSKHRNDDYVEGNAWQWTWFVPHDVDGLVALMGGQNKFSAKLDKLFSTSSEIKGEERSSDISGLIGQYAHGNEPSHHITHMYNYVDQSWKTQKLTDSIMKSLYFNNPNGLSGNEDCGQMSAWYVLNAMGFYSFNPGEPVYSIGRPIFDEVVINLTNGKKFKVITKNNTSENKYIQSIAVNGNALEKPFFNHDVITQGGIIEFEMGPTPNKELFK
ncbi:GH92 family glycosyl hydrolase [Joostella atrarenae]|uniref:GH92 family glycosyl hydrolase n=1 Tax=Joostella atrarenae TaxID=679257 RepID=A0ABS9J3S2_9FLAO|nr:GH92 family glycosyl hydrolase [Joostella atrarenae]MCF8714988.1 GH92 family glycosyl hydrolase [Joostella atrarenae]